MLLACYANGMVRLWNMLDARCIYKFKAGISAITDESENDEDEIDAVEEEKADIKASKDLSAEKKGQ